MFVNPTDYGTCEDIEAVAEVCHEFGKPLIVDEVWGAHLPFHPALPPWAMDASADLCVTSVHKSGSAVEQSGRGRQMVEPGEQEFAGPGRGYQAVDWLREHERVTVGLSDHRRIVAQPTVADDVDTAEVLVRSVTALRRADLPKPRPVELLSPDDLAAGPSRSRTRRGGAARR